MCMRGTCAYVCRCPYIYEVHLCTVCVGRWCVCIWWEREWVQVCPVCVCKRVYLPCVECASVSMCTCTSLALYTCPRVKDSAQGLLELPRLCQCVVLSACSWRSRAGCVKEDGHRRGNSPERFTSNPTRQRGMWRSRAATPELPGRTEGGGGHCRDWKQLLPTPSPTGLLLGPLQGGSEPADRESVGLPEGSGWDPGVNSLDTCSGWAGSCLSSVLSGGW